MEKRGTMIETITKNINSKKVEKELKICLKLPIKYIL